MIALLAVIVDRTGDGLLKLPRDPMVLQADDILQGKERLQAVRDQQSGQTHQIKYGTGRHIHDHIADELRRLVRHARGLSSYPALMAGTVCL